MKISVCLYDLAQGNPEHNLEQALQSIRAAQTYHPDLIVLPYGAISGFISPRFINVANLYDFCTNARQALANLPNDTSVIGTLPIMENSTLIQKPFHVDANGLHFLSNREISIKGQDLSIIFPNEPSVESTGPIIRLHVEPYTKNFIPDSPDNILNISPLGVQDTGKVLYTYTGHINSGTIIYDALQSGVHNFMYGSGEWQANSRLQEKLQPEQTLVYGIKNFFERLGINKLVIGLSGGIDSALNLLLYYLVLGKDSILAVNMPSQYNSSTTKGIAAHIATQLSIPLLHVPIQEVVSYTKKQLENATSEAGIAMQMSDLAYENVQARDRSGRILAGLAAMYNAVFPCNANKAEITVGYGTLYGDIAGALAATGDLWKHEVYQMAERLNHGYFNDIALPTTLFSLPPSAELSRQQAVDFGKGDPLIYNYHDYLFKAWTEGPRPLSIADTLALYANGQLATRIATPLDINSLFPTPLEFIEDCEHWWKLYRGLAVAKRLQAPPLLALSRYPFGHIQEVQGESVFSDEYFIIKEKLLSSK